MRYTVRPISDRTPFIGKHIDSQFRVTWSVCTELLERELEQLRGREVVIEVDVPERGIRMDGMLRGDARAATPAVRLAFESKHGPLTYATDRFVKPSYRRGGMADDWQHNLYAIALGLEALRKVDRYGITKRGEQYAGWKAIGAGPATAMPAGMSERNAAEVLERVAIGGEGSTRARVIDRIMTDPAHAKDVLRHARAACHPDRGGPREVWDQVELAGRTLGLVS